MPLTFIAPLLILFSTVGGGGNELLDVVDSKTYWQLAGVEPTAENLIPLAVQERQAVDAEKMESLVADLGSPDFAKRQKAMNGLAEAGSGARPFLEKAERSDDAGLATAAAALLSKVGRDARDTKRHQLMAIRSLGALRAAVAVPHLENLLDSGEPFIGEYAARSLAQIRGEKWSPRESDPDAFAKDLAITYPLLTAVLHTKSVPRAEGISARGMFDEAMAIMLGMQRRTAGDPARPPFAPDGEKILLELTQQLVRLVHTVGNIRLDSATVAIPLGIDLRDVGFVLTARGLYDHRRVLEVLKTEVWRGEPRTVMVEGAEWFVEDEGRGEIYFHFPSNELFVMVVGTKGQVEGYVEAVSARLAGKDKEPARGPAIDLVEALPEDARGLIAVEIPEAMREGFGGVSPQHILGSVTESAAGDLKILFEMEGSDPARLGPMIEEMQEELANSKEKMSAMAEGNSKLAELAKMVNSVKIGGDGAKYSAEMTVPKSSAAPFTLVFGSTYLNMMRARSAAEKAMRRAREREAEIEKLPAEDAVPVEPEVEE